MSGDIFEKVVSLCKRRGFVYPGSEIYSGLANTYDYGPLGVELLRNIKDLWWRHFVTSREEIFGLDSCVLMSPKVWEASGHVAHFADVLIDCKKCQYRTRADNLIEDHYEKKGKEMKVGGQPLAELAKIISEEEIKCPSCGSFNWTEPRLFNNLFETHVGIIVGEKNLAYLRGEIAQGMFVNFKNVLDSLSPKLPFGLAQSGVAFRNEITLGKFIFRTLQFNLSEFEYFFNPREQPWERLFEHWKGEMWDWATEVLGIDGKNLRWRVHTDEERAHYSKKTEDLEYRFPFGFKELYGLAYRTDFDLKNHMEKSGEDLRYTDHETGEKFIPHVMEPTFGMDRSFLALLIDTYSEEGGGLPAGGQGAKKRVVLRLPPRLAPYKVAVFPLVANKPELVKKARSVYELLTTDYELGGPVVFDDRGNIGKRYFAQDEIGTPWCITIDYQTPEDGTVTVRDRDTTEQERIKVTGLVEYFSSKLS